MVPGKLHGKPSSVVCIRKRGLTNHTDKQLVHLPVTSVTCRHEVLQPAALLQALLSDLGLYGSSPGCIEQTISMSA